MCKQNIAENMRNDLRYDLRYDGSLLFTIVQKYNDLKYPIADDITMNQVNNP